ncbi:unnamed protein product [Soboliphyme baturini]|uniref:Peptidase_M13_N domain-containing protein n=1 Tax=Soboliphyme baturini TaxID=241478 RepID=A0A183I8R3_9BILA|nr:unnamed protein product [Soboliphyme baturini]
MEFRRQQHRCIVKVFLAVTISVLVIVIVVVTSLLLHQLRTPTTSNSTPQAEDHDLPEVAEMLLGSIDNESQFQCINFYTYACGKFLAAAKAGETKASSTFAMLTKAVNERVINALNTFDVGNPQALASLKATVQIYRSCLQTNNISSDFAKSTIMKRINTLGGWPLMNSDWSPPTPPETIYSMMGKLGNRYGVASLFNWTVNVDWKNVSRNVLYLHPPRLPLQQIADSSLQTYMLQLARTLDKHVDWRNHHLDRDVRSFLNIIKEMAERIENSFHETANYDKLYNAFSVDEMKARWPAIGWNDFIRALFNLSDTYDLGGMKIIVTYPETIDALNTFIAYWEAHDNRRFNVSMVNYLVFLAIDNLTPFLTPSLLGHSEMACLTDLREVLAFTIGRLYVGHQYPQRNLKMAQ